MCTKKKKAPARKKIKGKTYPNYGPPSVSSDTRTAKEKFDANPARQAAVKRKQKQKKKAKQAAARQAALETQTPVEVVDEQVTEPVTPDGEAAQLPMDPVDVIPDTEVDFPKGPVSETDIETATGGTIGETAVTAQSIYQRDPEEAISDQERLAQEELRRQRIKRARSKQSLLRRRLERSREVGSGRRVLSGTERELNIQTRQAGTGRRRGAGRRSLITGSTGGIGYYSRFL
jgi:hypothetical protein